MSDSKEGKFYAEVCIKEFGVKLRAVNDAIWARFTPFFTSSISSRTLEGIVTHDIVFRSSQNVKVDKAFICHQDTYFCFTGNAIEKILIEPALLLCRQQRLRLKVCVDTKRGQLQTTKCNVNGKEEKCINVTEVVFQ